MNIPALNAKQLIRILGKKGFIQVRQSGSYIIFKHSMEGELQFHFIALKTSARAYFVR